MKNNFDQTGNSHYINRINKVNVLELIRFHEGISRAEIAKRSRLSPPTVSRIVENLIEDSFVSEMGVGQSRGGRRPTMLHFAGEKNLIIGIDLGTTHIYGILSDLNARVIKEICVPTNVDEGFNRIMDRTSGVIEKLLNEGQTKKTRILGAGMAVAGLINKKRNIVEFSPDFHWHNADVLKELTPRFDLPIIFDNVTRVMAIGELFYGIGNKYRHFICVNVGYGIGAGIIINGSPLEGPLGLAGEFGHVTLDRKSEIQCDCGNFGCLEALASGNAIAKKAQKALAHETKSVLFEMCGGDVSKVTAEMVAQAASQGDSLAWWIFDEAMDYLGVGIAGLINLFNPEAVVIGGGVAQAGDIVFEKVRKTVNARTLKKAASEVVIQPATFGLMAAVMGAVSLISDKVLNFEF